MFGAGHWHSPAIPNKVMAAIRALHNMYASTRGETYTESCPKCAKANKLEKDTRGNKTHVRKQWHSCSQHPNNPQLRARGMPCDDPLVKSVKQKVMDRLKAAHMVKGNVKLTPSDLRMLRNKLLFGNDPRGVQTYAMILIGVKLFLRSDEILRMEICDFQVQHFVISHKKVRCLMVKIRGKSDEVPIELILYRDDADPEFCPVRHILLYLRVCGIGRGCTGVLFPSWDVLRAHMERVAGADVPMDSEEWEVKYACRFEPSIKTTNDKGQVTKVVQNDEYEYAVFLQVMKRTIKQAIPDFFGADEENGRLGTDRKSVV